MLLERLKRWLGWSSESGLFDFSSLRIRSRPGTTKPAPAAATARTPESDPPGKRRAKAERSPMEVFDNPKLTLDKPADDGFDPYNTGAFNRSASWERIGRQRKR